MAGPTWNVVFKVTFKSDMFPGFGYDPMDIVKSLQKGIKELLPHYVESVEYEGGFGDSQVVFGESDEDELTLEEEEQYEQDQYESDHYEDLDHDLIRWAAKQGKANDQDQGC